MEDVLLFGMWIWVLLEIWLESNWVSLIVFDLFWEWAKLVRFVLSLVILVYVLLVVLWLWGNTLGLASWVFLSSPASSPNIEFPSFLSFSAFNGALAVFSKWNVFKYFFFAFCSVPESPYSKIESQSELSLFSISLSFSFKSPSFLFKLIAFSVFWKACSEFWSSLLFCGLNSGIGLFPIREICSEHSFLDVSFSFDSLLTGRFCSFCNTSLWVSFGSFFKYSSISAATLSQSFFSSVCSFSSSFLFCFIPFAVLSMLTIFPFEELGEYFWGNSSNSFSMECWIFFTVSTLSIPSVNV